MCGAIRAQAPVSPNIQAAESQREFADHVDQLQPGQQQLGAEPIVGKDPLLPPPPVPHGEARPLRSPKAPTAKERERHLRTHLPYQSWCPLLRRGEETELYP